LPLDSIRAGGAFVRAHGRHAVKFSRRSRALGRHRGAFESAVSTRCSRGPRHLDTPPLAPPRGAPIVHAGRLGTVRANYRMYSHSLRHVSASDGPIRHPKRHRSTHAGLRDSLAAHRPPRRRSTSTQALARASPRRRSCASRSRLPKPATRQLCTSPARARLLAWRGGRGWRAATGGAPRGQRTSLARTSPLRRVRRWQCAARLNMWSQRFQNELDGLAGAMWRLAPPSRA